MEKFIDPFTDFGFKKLFGEEANKDLLLDFLNELITEKGIIQKITFLKNEHLGISEADRKAIFDLYCESETGEKFIVELQKAKQKFFKDRSLYYSTFPIQEQAETGEWNFKLQTVYTIAIMDFVFDETTSHKFIHDVWLIEKDSQTVFNDKLRYIYLEMPKFNKSESQLQNKFDKWLFVLKNLARLQSRPVALQEKVFEKVLDVAQIEAYSPEEKQAYRDSLKYQRDLKNAMDTAFEEGEEKGKKEEKFKTARRMKLEGFDVKTIQNITGLSQEEIDKVDS